MSPKRVQMSRQRPWRPEHPDAVIVDRTTVWGNPFRVRNGYDVTLPDGSPAEVFADTAEHAFDAFRLWLGGHIRYMGTVPPSRDAIVRELAGRDLACWCPLDDPCHADVLLEVANREVAS